jgi:hypothetical protein
MDAVDIELTFSSSIPGFQPVVTTRLSQYQNNRRQGQNRLSPHISSVGVFSGEPGVRLLTRGLRGE